MSDFESKPNQKRVKIHREKVGKDNFFMINNETLCAAIKDLKTKGAILTWLYLAINADGYNKWVSPSNMKETLGLAEQTYRDNLPKLVEKGYLVITDKSHMEFYDNPGFRKGSTKFVNQARESSEPSRKPIEKEDKKNKKNNKEYGSSAPSPTVKEQAGLSPTAIEPAIINSDGYDNNGDFGF